MAWQVGESQTVPLVCYLEGVATAPTAPIVTEVNVAGAGFATTANPATPEGNGAVSVVLEGAEVGAWGFVRVVGDNGAEGVQPYTAEGDWTSARAEKIDNLALEATLTAMKGAGWTDETLVAIKSVLDAVTGDGAYEISFTLSDGAGTIASSLQTQIEDAGGNLVAGPITTDSLGQVTYWLDDDTYYLVTPSTTTWQGNSEEVVVSGDSSETVTLTKNERDEADGLTFGNMKSQVARILLDVFDERFDNNLIEKWIRSAHMKTDTEIKWTRDKLTLTTEAGESAYSTIASRRNIIRLTDSDLKPLEYIEFDEYIERESSSGTPDAWTVWGGDIIMHPTPVSADTYTLWVVRLPGPMTCDGDIPSLPAELHQAIVDYALHRAYVHLEDMIAADVYYKKWAKSTVVFGKDASDYRGKKERIRDVEGF